MRARRHLTDDGTVPRTSPSDDPSSGSWIGPPYHAFLVSVTATYCSPTNGRPFVAAIGPLSPESGSETNLLDAGRRARRGTEYRSPSGPAFAPACFRTPPVEGVGAVRSAVGHGGGIDRDPPPPEEVSRNGGERADRRSAGSGGHSVNAYTLLSSLPT
ncbi:hypothetical protein BRC68_02950 [Halobacteriales archaeon QH_6_64_20]|nr:MAG: hypothetical protein BRC68_02950 [Halobacteriales archaeon QH_6_64_20]